MAIPLDKRIYFKRVGMTDRQIDDLEDELAAAAKAAEGLEFKSKTDELSPSVPQLIKSVVLQETMPAGLPEVQPVDRAAHLVVNYLETMRNSGQVMQAVMGPVFRDEVVGLVSDEFVASMEDADREQVRDAIRNRVMIMEAEDE